MKKLILIVVLLLTVCGRVVIAAPAGWSLISNPLDSGAAPIPLFLPVAPPETLLFKYTPLGYETETYIDGFGWFPGAMTLSPGEGAFIYLPVAAALGFLGAPLVPPHAVPIPAGYSMCSAPSGLGMLLFPAAEGDIIYTFIVATQSYDYYEFIAGAWFPAVPPVAVGEAFWVVKSAPAVWIQ